MEEISAYKSDGLVYIRTCGPTRLFAAQNMAGFRTEDTGRASSSVSGVVRTSFVKESRWIVINPKKQTGHYWGTGDGGESVRYELPRGVDYLLKLAEKYEEVTSPVSSSGHNISQPHRNTPKRKSLLDPDVPT
ncbi:MAG: hypothetical protein AB7E52_07810 [Bdellovibrionales bacterium]